VELTSFCDFQVITKAGLINLVKLTEEEIPSLNLSPKESDDLRIKLDHIKSLPLLRQLGRLLVGPKAGPLPQNAIVFMVRKENHFLQTRSFQQLTLLTTGMSVFSSNVL